MKLSDLLDELRRNILNDRSDRVSGTADYLWDDTTLVRYINEAQRRFALQGYVIHDATTAEVVNVTVRQGVTQYDLHQAIIDVVSARLDGQVADLTRVGHSLLASFTNPADRVIFAQAFEQLPPGPPAAFSTDEGLSEDDSGTRSVISMRLYPTPRAEDDGTLIKLRVVRKPLDDLTTNSMSAIPEIPEDHHLEMLCWAAHLALSIADDDAGNQGLADRHAARFQSYVEDARKLVLRKMFAPQPWGFGRNGFSWGGPQHGGFV